MDFRDVVKDAKRQGFQVVQTKNGHWRFLPPDKTMNIVIAGGTPSDRRPTLNLVAELRRSGFVWRVVR